MVQHYEMNETDFPLVKIKDELEKNFDVMFKFHERQGREWITAKTHNGFITITYFEGTLRFDYDETFYAMSDIVETYEELDKFMTKYFKERRALKLF